MRKLKGIVLNSNKVLLAMANQNMTIGKFCDKADIFSGTYRRMMKGAEIKPATAGKIAKALNVKVQDLLEE